MGAAWCDQAPPSECARSLGARWAWARAGSCAVAAAVLDHALDLLGVADGVARGVDAVGEQLRARGPHAGERAQRGGRRVVPTIRFCDQAPPLTSVARH